MPEHSLDTAALEVVARGDCGPGFQPNPPLQAYPLLAWSKDHPRFFQDVHLEDQRASVQDAVNLMVRIGSAEDAARMLGTTVEHVRQALRYAEAARFGATALAEGPDE